MDTFCSSSSKEGQTLLGQGEDALKVQIDYFRESGVLGREVYRRERK